MGLIPVTAAERFHSAISQRSTGLFNQLSSAGLQLYGAFWKNPDQVNLSPDKAWAAMGTDGVTARHAYLGMAAFVNAMIPGTLPAEPAGWTLTENQDGTVVAVVSA